MEESTNIFLTEEIPYLNDVLTAGRSLYSAMARFYLYNRQLLRLDCSRLVLMNRIAGCLEVELDRQEIGNLYAADLIHIGEQLNIGVRGRRRKRCLMALDFRLHGKPRLDHLERLCGDGPDRYKFGAGIGLNRNCYLLEWHVPSGVLNRETELYFLGWMNRAFFLGPNPPPRYLYRLEKIRW